MKKKILLFLALIVILATGFIFLVPVKDGRTVYKTIKYNRLLAGAIQANNYDKMKISYVQIVERKTGTEKFNTPDYHSVDDGSILSDMDGHDVSEKDDYVRTVDTFEYMVEVGAELNLDHPDVDTSTQLTGGVIKIKATIPDFDGITYYHWVQEPWMKNVSITNEGRTLYADYYYSLDDTIVGGNQQLSFRLVTGNRAKTITSQEVVKFEVWMEGNEPDNSDSLAESMTVSDNNDLFITGGYHFNTYTNQGGAINVSGTINNVEGQYIGIGLGSFISNPINNSGQHGGKYPVEANNAEIEIKLDYYYKESAASNYSLVPGENVNGVSLLTYNKYEERNENAYPTSTSNNAIMYADFYGERTVSFRGKTSKSNYGTSEAVIEGDKLKVKVSGFNNTIFPYNSLLPISYPSIQAAALFGYSYEIFLPFYIPDETGSYNYKLTYTIVSAKLTDDDGNEVFDLLGPENSNTYLTNNVTFSNRVTGDYNINLTSSVQMSTSSYGVENGYIYPDVVDTIKSTNSVADGPYNGGELRLITFDGAKLEIVQKDGKWYDFSEENDKNITPNTSTTNQTMKYGIYKLNPSVGLNTDALVNSTVIEDFDWYDSVVEAKEHGVITAVLWDNPDYDGFYKKDTVSFYVKAIDCNRDDGTTALLRQKAWLYADGERNTVFGIYTSNEEDFYKPSVYATGYAKKNNGNPFQAGETILIMKGYQYFNVQSTTRDKSNFAKTNFGVDDEIIRWEFQLYDGRVLGEVDRDAKDTMYIGGQYDSKYISLIPESCNYEPYSINTYGDTKVFLWKYDDVSINELPVKVYCDFYINPLTPNSTKIAFNYRSTGYSDNYNYYNGFAPTSITRNVTITNLAGSSTRLIPSRSFMDTNSSMRINADINNLSGGALNNVKSIQLLPKDGDDKGSSFHGTYTIKIDSKADDLSIYYTVGDIDEVGIETDARGYKNIKNVDLPNDDRWIQVDVGDTIPSNATAIATLTSEIPNNTSKTFSYTFTASGNKGDEVYYFGQYASSDTMEESMFSSYKYVWTTKREIVGVIFDDYDRDGLLDEGDEDYIDGYHVELLNEDGEKIDETDSYYGYYEFEVEKGKYYIRFANLPDGYELTPKGTTKYYNKANANMQTDLLDFSANAQNSFETITYVNLGMRKKAATLTVKYLDKSTGQLLADQIETTVYYTDTYQTTGLTTLPENYSFIENAGDPVSEVVNKDNIEVIYYYDLTPATVTARHYLDGTTTKVHEDVVQNKKFTQPYETSRLDLTNYDYVRTDGDAESGTVSKTSYVVNYYYKLKTGTVTTHHYLYDNGETTTKLAQDVSRTWNYTDTYTTSVSNEVPSNYEFYKKSDNFTAVMSSPSVEVNYYYRLKDSSLTTSITKTGPEEITDKNAEVNYTITYNAKVTDYIGEGTITIVDNLPYKIDASASNLDGGTYDDSNKTITWTINWSDIDTYSDRDEYIVTKNILLKYVAIVGRDRIMTSSTVGTITLSNNSREALVQTSTNIRIKGKIKVTYTDKDTGEEIFDPVEEEDLVGEQFISSAQEKDGYKLVTKPDSEEFEFEEEEQLIKYEYEHIKFEIKGEVVGEGGTITGDENVFWGEDSTVDNIVIQADEGYIIEAIIVNGERLELVLGEEKVILSNFINVLEDKNIQVIFAKKPQENPNTKASMGWILLVSWLIFFTLVILIKKVEELE